MLNLVRDLQLRSDRRYTTRRDAIDAGVTRGLSICRCRTADRAFLAALLHRLPKLKLRQLHLIVSPDTVLRWHRDLMPRRHADASRRSRSGRPPTRRSSAANHS